MKPAAVDPKATTRVAAFELWMDAPNPMVTFFKTLDVTPLARRSRKRGDRFNMLLCWCIGRAAGEIREFYLLPVGRELLQYDSIAVNTIVKNKNGEVSSCDVPFSEDLAQFNADYLRLTRETAEACKNHDLTDSMVIGTSAIVDTEIDGAVGMNSGIFNNPFLIWGRYHRGIFKTTLKLSFQFHHTQMAGAFGGNVEVQVESRTFDGNTAVVTALLDGSVRKTYTVAFYDGGYRYVSVTQAEQPQLRPSVGRLLLRGEEREAFAAVTNEEICLWDAPSGGELLAVARFPIALSGAREALDGCDFTDLDEDGNSELTAEFSFDDGSTASLVWFYVDGGLVYNEEFSSLPDEQSAAGTD